MYGHCQEKILYVWCLLRPPYRQILAPPLAIIKMSTNIIQYICQAISIDNCMILYFLIMDKNTTPFYFSCRIVEGIFKIKMKMRVGAMVILCTHTYILEGACNQASQAMGLTRACNQGAAVLSHVYASGEELLAASTYTTQMRTDGPSLVLLPCGAHRPRWTANTNKIDGRLCIYVLSKRSTRVYPHRRTLSINS